MLDVLAKIGPFLSGIALLCAAVAAWITLLTYQRRSAEKEWVDGFREIYAEFWKDEDMAQVRAWIVSKKEYELLKPILVERLKTEENSLDAEANRKLELIDRFCSMMIRLQFFTATARSENREVWRELYDLHWLGRVKQRPELSAYVKSKWPNIQLGSAP